MSNKAKLLTKAERKEIIREAEAIWAHAWVRGRSENAGDEPGRTKHLVESLIRYEATIAQVEAERDTLQEIAMRLASPDKRQTLVEMWRDIQYAMETDEEDPPYWTDNYRRWADALEGLPWPA